MIKPKQNKPYWLALLLMAVFAFSNAALAKNGNGNSGNKVNSTSPATCSISDISFDANGNVIACAGQFSGNDSHSTGWLGNQPIWKNGQLSNDADASVSQDTWVYLTKYNTDIQDAEMVFDNNTGTYRSLDSVLQFTNCLDKDGGSVACSGDWKTADFVLAVDTALYDQFVFVNKAANYYSLYQIDILANVTALSGTMSMVTKNALSHFTLWAREGVPVSDVSEPSVIALMMFAMAVMIRQRKRALS